MSFSQEIKAELLEKTKDEVKERQFIRDCFLQNGVISNPGRTYHLQFSLSEETADELMTALTGYNLQPKKIARSGQFVVYLKEADGIADVLNIIGAHKSLLTFEGMRVEKSIRNSINRKVNFETANINKTVGAALSQIDAIKLISQHSGLGILSPPLEAIARLRLSHETASLAEIGAMLTPSISKSAVNHRLRKICKIAENMRGVDFLD